MASEQILNYGTVVGFVSPDIAIISDGVHSVHAYIPFQTPKVSVGQSFSIYKQGSTYFVGSEVKQ